MFFRKLSLHLKEQNGFAVALGFLIVVIADDTRVLIARLEHRLDEL